ncbi:MAG: autoinducer binding domain-containing protein [Acidihalobacter sp.]|uniref:autoinducer binding domain-containing protein n=1 Tax=Acidihalobacter sp. TaxID=1872108 RepID=UPI00307E2B5E
MLQIDTGEVLEKVVAVQVAEDLVSIIHRFVMDMGFEHFSFGVRWPIPITQRSVDILDAYPTGWMNHYLKQGYLEVDPTVRRGIVESDLIYWDADLFSSARALWDDAHDCGLRHGVAQSAWGRGGAFGLLSAARERHSIRPDEYDRLRAPFSWAANTFHARLTTLLRPPAGESEAVELTPREREVVLWTAEGKTASEIASIIGCTKRTVEFHLKNTTNKLHASNKTHAVVYALGKGLLMLQ